MFSTKDKDMAKPNETSGVVNLIGVGTTISEISLLQEISVLTERSKAQSTQKERWLSELQGLLKEMWFVRSADVSGELKAKVSVSELLVLKSTAKLDGDIVTNKLAIEPGANFSGHVAWAQ